jgi:hypothetical protein
MTISVTVTHDEAGAERAIEVRVQSVNAGGYSAPWTEVLPGQAATFHVEQGVVLEVREGGVLPLVLTAEELAVVIDEPVEAPPEPVAMPEPVQTEESAAETLPPDAAPADNVVELNPAPSTAA